MIQLIDIQAGDLGSKLGWEDSLGKEMAIHSIILAWQIPWMEEPVGYSPWGRKELDMTEQLQMVTAAMKLKDAYSLEGKL